MNQVIMVTGSSHGIGLATVERLAKAGYRVYATTRDVSDAKELHALSARIHNISIEQLDVRSDVSVNRAVQNILRKEGKIDVVINNAGFGIYGPSETLNMGEIFRQFDTNVFGVMRVIHAVAPHMRARNSGRIINISSVSGIAPSKNMPVYSATKAALESLTASYACHLYPIKFVSIQPGPVVTDFEPRTPFGHRFKKDENPYREMLQKSRYAWKKMMDGGQSPFEVAQVIQKAIESNNPDLWYQTSQAVSDLVRKHFRDPTGNNRIPVGFPPISKL